MLKLGSVRWRGKCSRHPMFDPSDDGPGAVKGGCPRCATLVEIHTLHVKMLTLMRGFAPPQTRKRAPVETVSAQTSFFDQGEY